MLPLIIPLIWTNSDLVPLEFVTVHAGPGECQPGGVGPGVSHRFALPPETDVVVPGVKGLAENDAEPVLFAVMSLILTIVGVHSTLGFHDVEV